MSKRLLIMFCYYLMGTLIYKYYISEIEGFWISILYGLVLGQSGMLIHVKLKSSNN